MTKKSQKEALNFSKYLGILLFVVSIIFLGLLYFINIIPDNYFLALLILVGILDLILIKCLWSKSIIKNIISSLFAIILSIAMVFGINYELNTLAFLKQFGFNSYKTENYNVVVLKDSGYKNIKDLKNKKIARLSLIKNEGLEKANKRLKQEIEYIEKEVEDISDLYQLLKDKEVAAILLEDTQIDLLKEENEEFNALVDIIDKIEVEITILEVTKDVDITKEPFNIYITGIDTYGRITKVSRSDVNLLLTVNPKSKEIIMTSIPRDYYVKLHAIDEMDKLTHAGIYGIETQVKMIEDLLDTKINYYIKVNFTSLISIVDALDNIVVDSDIEFTTIDGITFKKGKNVLDGQKALAFVRERKAFKEGDRIRGKNQMKVLEAIINKAMGPSILSNYNELLGALKGKFITDLEENKIKNFIKKNLNNLDKYHITNISLDGMDAYDYTYSYKKNKLYVMKPYEESVIAAKDQINKIYTK